MRLFVVLSRVLEILDAQNRHIIQLTSRNKEFVRLYHSKSKEIEDLHSKMIEHTHNKWLSCQEIHHMSKTSSKSLKRRICFVNSWKKSLFKGRMIWRTREEVISLVQSRYWLQIELNIVQRALAQASHQFASLEEVLHKRSTICFFAGWEEG